ncbi:MAG: hypothetical protein L7F77_14345 [Candidatus Magnetominusculus sp. LBB02]|nr:hypothetical protein [Candidatus Magnetominusculus sp. LBB02]
MTFNKKVKDIFWISCNGWSSAEYGDYVVGETFPEELAFFPTEIEPSESTVKSLKRVDINVYEGVGRLFDLTEENGPSMLFDCGIYAYASDDTDQYLIFPEGIESGSYVKMRFTLEFDEGFCGLQMNGEPIHKLIPEIEYDWIIKDILVLVEDDKYFTDLPVAYTSSTGKIYKRIRHTIGRNDCGGNAQYVFVCQML